MAGDLHGFPILREDEALIRPVEGCIGPVYGTVVVRAYEQHIVQRIIAAAAQPVYVVRFTEIPLVQGLGVPSAELAHASVQLPQLLDMLWVALWGLLEQVAAALIRDSGGLSCNETANSIAIAEEDTGL